MPDKKKFCRPRDYLNTAHHILSRHCDDPLRQVLLHLAWMFGLSGDGQDSWKAVVRSGYDLERHYTEFVRGARLGISGSIKTDRPVPDYIGSFVSRFTTDKYETEEFVLTPTDLVHVKNKQLLHPDERGKRLVAENGVEVYMVEDLTPSSIVPFFDPTMGTGRVGMDVVCYHPSVTYWGIERDLDTYRIALLSGQLIAPFSRSYVAGLPATRWHVLWADSLIVDVRDTSNWEAGMNKWDPPDWQAYSRTRGKTWADLQQALAEGNVSAESAHKGGTHMGTVANGLPQSRFPGALTTPQSQ